MALQDHSFKHSKYERPNQDWICGWSKEGWSCKIGPRENGSCRAASECFPIKKGDRWFCTRQESDGGPCQEGPLPAGNCSIPIPPCQPILSLRKRRGRVSFWTIVLTLGILFLILPYPNGSVLVSPGDIHAVHGNFGEQCERCHLTSSEHVAVPVVDGLSKAESIGDSQLCLSCHQFGVNGMRVHNQSPKALDAVTGRLKSIQGVPSPPLSLRVLNWLPDGFHAPSQSTACGTCHQEHQGKSSNLQSMDDQSCQVCHTIQFSGFGDGHPELETYPYKRRTRVAFDHNSHIDKHFLKEDKNNDFGSCDSCHGLSSTNQTMFTKAFNTSCAKCHTQELKGIGNEASLVFFRLPEIDLFSLGEKRIGAWPEDLKGDLGLEQDLTPFMRLLLETKSSATVPLAQQQLSTLAGDFTLLQEHGHLYDLESAGPEVLEASERIIWAIKNLLFELSTQGQQAIITRLKGKKISSALGRTLGNKELSALAAQLPIGVLQTAQQAWFPRLEEEIRIRRKANQESGRAVSDLSLSPAIFAQEKSSFSYDPSVIGENEDGDFDLERMLEGAASKNTGIGGDDIFTDDSIGDDISSQSFSEEEGADEEVSGVVVNGQESEEEDVDPAEVQERDKKREGGVSTGGWYHSNSDFSIKFRRSGHEDRFSYAWLNLANDVSSTSMNPSGSQLLAHLANSFGSGSCLRCHSLDQQKDENDQMFRQTINWSSFRQIPHYQPSTHFSHGSHFSLVSKEKTCQTCHMRKESEEKDWTKIWFEQNTNPLKYSSNFKPIAKETCSTCHQKNSAGEQCLLCHNYHIGQSSVKLVNQ